MALRKLDLMHRFFGVSDGHTCRECSNFTKGKIHSKTIHKCTDTTRQFRLMWRTWKPNGAFPKFAHSVGRNSRRGKSSRKSIAVWSARKPTLREPLKGDTAIEKIRNWRYKNNGRTGFQI